MDKVLRAKPKMMNKQDEWAWALFGNGNVAGGLPMETVYEITQWFGKRPRAECRAPAAWTGVPAGFGLSR